MRTTLWKYRWALLGALWLIVSAWIFSTPQQAFASAMPGQDVAGEYFAASLMAIAAAVAIWRRFENTKTFRYFAFLLAAGWAAGAGYACQHSWVYRMRPPGAMILQTVAGLATLLVLAVEVTISPRAEGSPPKVR